MTTPQLVRAGVAGYPHRQGFGYYMPAARSPVRPGACLPLSAPLACLSLHPSTFSGITQHVYLTVSGALILVPGDISGRDEDMQGDLTDFREYSLQQLAIRLSLRHQHQHVLVLYHL